MTYIYAKVDDLDGTPKVGSRECVALLQHYAKLPITKVWKQGKPVFGDLTIAKGTAIATFVDGHYQSHEHGNHAAFYLSQTATGILVMDQWRDDKKKPTVSTHLIRKQGRLANGTLIDPSNNADAYSVIE